MFNPVPPCNRSGFDNLPPHMQRSEMEGWQRAARAQRQFEEEREHHEHMEYIARRQQQRMEKIAQQQAEERKKERKRKQEQEVTERRELQRQRDFLNFKERAEHKFRDGQYREAIDYYERAIQEKGDVADIYYSRGICYLIIENYSRAIKDLNESIRLDSTNMDAFHRRGFAHMRQGDIEDAIKDFEKVKLSRPDQYDVIGHLHLLKEEFDKAVLAYNQFFGMVPSRRISRGTDDRERRIDDPDVRQCLALAQSRQGKHEQAVLELDRSLELIPDKESRKLRRVEVLILKGELLLTMHKPEGEVKDCFEQVRLSNPVIFSEILAAEGISANGEAQTQAQFNIAMKFYFDEKYERRVCRNDPLFLHFIQKSVRAKHAESFYRLAVYEGRDLIKAEYYRKAAEGGYGQAKHIISNCHFAGADENQLADYNTARKWISSSFGVKQLTDEQLEMLDKFHAGMMCLRGIFGFSQNIKQAAKYFQELHEGGCLLATNMLGYLYDYGFIHVDASVTSDDATEQDYQKARELYQRASENNRVPVAKYHLAWLYYNAQGVIQDRAKAFQLFSEAYELGIKAAASPLGRMLYHGFGTHINYEQAFQYCRLAEHFPGYKKKQAYFYLALMYYFGKGTAVDIEKAQEYLGKESQRDHTLSQVFRFGIFDRHNRGDVTSREFARERSKEYSSSNVLKPKLCTNKRGDVILVFESPTEKGFYYRVGKIQEDSNITWGEDVCVSKSDHSPSVAINDDGNVIVVHSYNNKLYYHAGKLEDDFKITWWTVDRKYTDGVQPSIAISGDRVFEIHKGESRDELFYCTGYIGSNFLNWHKTGKMLDRSGKDPAVCIDSNNNIIIIYTSKDFDKRLIVTSFRWDIWDEWNIHKNVYHYNISGPGYIWSDKMSIHATPQGNFILTYECEDIFLRGQLLYRIGHVNSQKKFHWITNEFKPYDIGSNPTAIVTEQNQMISVHELEKEICTHKQRI